MRRSAHDDVDLGRLSAEAQLDRLDDGTAPTEVPSNGRIDRTGTLDLSHPEADGLHIETDDPDPYAVGADDPGDVHDPADLIAAIEAFTEAFNARDLDALLDLLADDCETPGLGNDCANFAEAVDELWERRPSSLLTRGLLEDRPLAVLWEVGDDAGWWRVAPVMFDAVGDDGRIGVVELNDDPTALDGVEAERPDDDLVEGSRWSEWEEGADS